MREGIWLKALFNELGEEVKSIEVLEDNNAAIRIACNPILSQRSKAIDIRYHIARFYVQRGDFNISYISTENQLADALTKAVPEKVITKFLQYFFELRK